MRQEEGLVFRQSKRKTAAMLNELLTGESANFSAVDRHNYFEYVECLAKELSNISNKADNLLLSYLLNLAVQEAGLAKRIIGREISIS
jgi:hypothetical protein